MPKSKTSTKQSPTDNRLSPDEHQGETHDSNEVHGHSHGVQHPLLIESTTFEFSIPWETVNTAYQKVIKKYQPHVKTDGFRKGKVPAKIVEQMVGKQQLFEETAQLVVPQAYVDAATAGEYKPLGDPEIHPVKTDEGKAWEFHAHISVYPEMKLGKYKDAVKKALKDVEKEISQISKDDTKEETEEKKKAREQEKRIDAVLTALQSSINPQVPELLVRQETNRLLDQLERQLKIFKIEPASYFKSMNKTAEEIQQEYMMQAITTWQLEFILDTIGKEDKIEVTDTEVEEILLKQIPDQVGDDKKLTEDQKANYRLQIQQSLKKQKVIDSLLAL